MKKIVLFFQSVKESIDSIKRTCYRIQYLLEELAKNVQIEKID